MSRQYYGIEVLNLTTAQKNTLLGVLQSLGRDNQHPQPCMRNHWRIRPDNNAIIFEGNFDDEHWTAEAIKTRLSAALAVSAGLVTHTTTQSQYGPVVTFTRTTARLRLVAFGGLLASWGESWTAVQAYLKANQAAWDPPA